MIMMCLHPTHVHPVTEVDTTDALVDIETMREGGVPIQTRTFRSPAGQNVTVFWTTDGAGTVATVWEHTFEMLSFNVPAIGGAEESAVLQETDRVLAGRDIDCPDHDGYAVGE